MRYVLRNQEDDENDNSEEDANEDFPSDTPIKKQYTGNFDIDINPRKLDYQIITENQEVKENDELENEDNTEKIRFEIDQEAINYPNNHNILYNQDENIKINNSKRSSSESNKIYNNNNIIFNPRMRYKEKQNKLHKDIPKLISFQKSQINTQGNSITNLNLANSDNFSELKDKSRTKYHKYVGWEIIYIEGGLNTGKYKFKGEEIKLTQGGDLENIGELSKEEILKEINRRQNKIKTEKGKRFKIVDKYHVPTKFERKPLYISEKKEQIKKEFQHEKTQKDSLLINGRPLGFKFKTQQKMENINNNISNYQQLESSQLNQNSEKKYKINSDINLQKDLNIDSEPNDTFSKKILTLINNLRTNPQSYIQIIEEAKKNIIKDKKGTIIYNHKVKVALLRGEAAFNEAINYLKNIEPMDRLIFNPYLVVETPKRENEIKDKNDLALKVDNMVNDGIMIKSFWRDVIKDPKISFLMMIVDDIGEKSGMRRKDLLDINMKYIGISSVNINGSFVCYITLG